MADQSSADADETTTAPAMAILDELYDAGKLTETQFEKYKRQFSTLHETVLALYSNEKRLLTKGRQLKQDLLVEKQNLEATGVAEGDASGSLESLQEDLEAAKDQVQMAEEKEAMLQLQIAEYQRQKMELEDDIEEAKRRKAAEFEPFVRQLEADIAELHSTIAQQKESIQKMDKEKKDNIAHIQEMQQKITDLDAQKLECTAERRKVSGEPDKILKQAEVVANAKKTLQRELDKLEERSHEIDVTHASNAQTQKALETKGAELELQLDQKIQAKEEKEQILDKTKKEVAVAQAEMEDELSKQVTLELEMKGKLSEAKHEQEQLVRKTKEKDAALRRVKKAEQDLKMAKDSVGPVTRMLEATRVSEADIVAKRKMQATQLEELQRDHEICMYNFLKHEKVEKVESDKWDELRAEIKDLNTDLNALTAKDQELGREAVKLSAARELASRESSKLLRKLADVTEELKVKDIYIADLGKKKAEVKQRWKQFEKLYDLTKNERNKNVNLIQAASQGLAEWKEKIKILQNEVDILSSDSQAKAVNLTKTRLSHQSEITSRDANRAEVNKNLVEYRKAREQVEQQLVEIDKLNAIINTIERDMLRLKRHYETAVEDRNYTGIQLIDRNDELCILYEKHNIQEQVLTKGELELQSREEDIRRLNLERIELAREKEVVRKFLPLGPELEADAAALQKELVEARHETVSLSDILESPENDRWRLLPGTDPSPATLAETIKTFEERLNDKKEQLLEKELVLEEVTSLSDRLRQQANEGRDDTLELAKRVNDFQARIRSMTKKMMATVSELSMYQATAMKLQQEKHESELSVQDAKWRLEQGQAPNEEAELEWERIIREEALRRELRAEQVQQPAAPADAFAPAQITRTTAEPRPNAYIPDDIGIPKPYGALAPFKPSTNGRGLSHIRKPQPKEIEI
eukprot:SAG31_NODE_2263_length_6060_cov_12.232344_2_plen_926_part_00